MFYVGHLMKLDILPFSGSYLEGGAMTPATIHAIIPISTSFTSPVFVSFRPVSLSGTSVIMLA
jgi:hypothetical protein